MVFKRDSVMEQARLDVNTQAEAMEAERQRRIAAERALVGMSREEWGRNRGESLPNEFENEWQTLISNAQKALDIKTSADTAAKLAEEERARQFATAEAGRVAASTEQQRIIASIAPEAEAMRTSLLGQTEADRARIEALVSEHVKPVDTTARRAAEEAKVTLQTEQALTKAGKRLKSEAAQRGGLYGGGYIGAMSEAIVTGELSKVERMASFEERLAVEQEEKGKIGLAYTMDLYKTHAQNVFQAYSTAYNIIMEKAKMAQNAGQFDAQLMWEQQGLQINQSFQKSMTDAQIAAQERQAVAERELKLLLAKRDELQRELDRAFTAGENDKARAVQLQIAEINADAAKKQAEATASAGMWSGIGNAIGVGAGLLI